MPTKKSNIILPSPLSFMDKVAAIEKKQRRRVIRFDLAEPQFAPPQRAISGTISAIKQGKYRYGPSRGLPELITEIRSYLLDTRGLMYDDGEVLVTTGGKFANYAFFSSLLKQGDEIVVLKPFWTSFAAVPEMLGLKRVEVWSDEPYHLNYERLQVAMHNRPKVLVVNTPNNPTGGMLNEEDIKFLRDLATDHDLIVLSDEIDWAYTYDGRRHISPAASDELRERTVVTDGFSKIYSMTGWRVGFAAGPMHIIEKMRCLQEHSISAPATFAQYGCVEALKSRQEYLPKILKRCDSNRRDVVKTLSRIESLDCPMPEGGFYVYPKVLKSHCTNSSALCDKLLEDGGVSVIPGSLFGDDRMTFRLCYAIGNDLLKEGLRRLQNFFEKQEHEQ
jgi:aspartate aminotransferase